MSHNLTSVIVTTKNNERTIRDCLQSIKNQSVRTEILVVDNFSTDRTKSIARRFTTKVFTKGPERSAQRNYGIKKSKGKYCLFLDSDMKLSKRVVEKGELLLEKNPDSIGVYIPERIVGKSLFSKIRNFERSFYDGTSIDCVRMIRKDKAVSVGGFDENLYAAEDWDFQKRISSKGKSLIMTNPLYHNEEGISLFSYVNKKKYYSKNINEYVKKWGQEDPDVKKQLGFRYRYIGVYLENGKWKKCIGSIDLFIGMLFLKILVGFVYKVYEKR